MQEELFGQQATSNILVYGWYNKNNIGDDLFCEAFKKLFPNVKFTFIDQLTVNNVKDSSVIFIGGGSFLNSNPFISNECLNLIKTKKIFYIGVGAETDIHPSHKELITSAKLIAIRSHEGIEKISQINSNVIVIPDIVYALKHISKIEKKHKSILILPNLHAVPQNGDAHWKHSSWERFKFEFSQFLDYVIEDGYKINFFSMCKNKHVNDDWAAYEIISNMQHRGDYLITAKSSNIKDVFDLFASYDVVITQRFHGMIISEIVGVPFVSIYHHDKLKSSYLKGGKFISMYASCRRLFIDEFYLANQIELQKSIAIESDIFESLKEKVNSILFES